MTYELYKPLRNHLRQYSLLESLGVVRAYVQHLQFDQAFPSDIEVDATFLRASDVEKRVYGVHEWELELLAKELILNAPDIGKKDLRSWKEFSTSINKIKSLENNIGAYSAYRTLFQKNVLLELYRIAHRQFPWQQKPDASAIIRYFKIFSHPEVEPIVIQKLGLNACQLYTLGLLFVGFFLDKFGLEYPVKVEVPGFTPEHVDLFIRHFATNLVNLREKIAQQQSYDQDFAYVMNALIVTPLVWVTLRGKKTLIAPIPTYLLRRFTEGIYYEICNAESFAAAFGKSVQQYVGEVVAAATQNMPMQVLPEQAYRVGKEEKNSVDWILSDNTGSIFIECKAKKIRFAAKIALADTAILDEDLAKMAGFIVQAYKTLADANAGLYEHWKPTGQPVYPMVVTLEEWFAFGDRIMQAIDQRVKIGMESANLSLDMLDANPYSICSVKDLERAVQVMAQTGIERFMKQKNDGEHRLWSYNPMMYRYFREELKKCRDLFPDAANAIHPNFSDT
jgi:hypothetical protein